MNENGAWYLWDPSSSDTTGGAGAMVFSRDGHRSGAPTPTPADGRRLQATSYEGWGVGAAQGNANDDDDYDGVEDVVTVSVFSHQVRGWRARVWRSLGGGIAPAVFNQPFGFYPARLQSLFVWGVLVVRYMRFCTNQCMCVLRVLHG